ncbi:MAG: nucleotidyl transferase AbiEii/AbiGii toxin family protein [Planctomycetes bacterium]|nr:nucleotidyl transferase AbiEii/AbiGii toxin family protein [Planctomycetota bacterium]
MLDFPAPELLVYPRDAVVAEKLEAMVVLGDRNSRIKDFFDLHYLASHFEFDREVLVEAVRKTFERRRTAIPAELPIGLSSAYWENPSRPTQVRAFARRAGLAAPTQLGGAFAALLREFLAPLLEELHSGRCRAGRWLPGGPWECESAAREAGPTR